MAQVAVGREWILMGRQDRRETISPAPFGFRRRSRDDSWNKRKGDGILGVYSYIEESCAISFPGSRNPLAIPAPA